MGTSPGTFFRFLSQHADLILALLERDDVDEADLRALIARHRSEGHPAEDHVRAQIEELGILERAAHAESSLELAQPVVELLAWLTRRQRLSSATVLRAYLDDLAGAERDLEGAIHSRDVNTAVMTIKDMDGLVERVRSLSNANRDATITEAQTLRAVAHEASAVERFETVRRLWERYLEPLRQLVAVQGEMERRLGRLHGLLEEGEQCFIAHGPLSRAFTRAIARLARMRRAASEDHLAAIVEIAPLYERFRRDSRWVLGASLLLKGLSEPGNAATNLDQSMGLVGWRPRYLMSDDELRARIAGLVGYEPVERVMIASSPSPTVHPLIARDVLRAALHAAAPVKDVLGLVLAHWPEHSLSSQLRAFGIVAGGAFGRVAVDAAAGPQRYAADCHTVEAWPLMLMEVIA